MVKAIVVDRGRPLLRARRARPQGHDPRARHQPGPTASVQGGSSITQQLVKQTLLNQAKTKEEREAATDDTYARKLRELRYAIALREEVLQGLDPRALPQHRLLRRRRLRHPGGRPALLLQQRQPAQPPPVRDARRPRARTPRLRPDQLPRAVAQAAQRRARPDGRAQRHHASARPSKIKAQDLGLKIQKPPQRLRRLPGAVLLRLRRRLPAEGPGARRDRGAPAAAPPAG